MKATVETVLHLYQELNAIFDNNDIRYITGGQAADMIFNCNNRDHHKGVIYIDDTEMDKVTKILKEGLASDRQLEPVANEGRKDSIRYINKNTTFIEFSSFSMYI